MRQPDCFCVFLRVFACFCTGNLEIHKFLKTNNTTHRTQQVTTNNQQPTHNQPTTNPQPMSVTLGTVATEQIVCDLVDASAVNANGTRWNATSSIPQLQISASKLLAETVRRNDDQPVTLGTVLCADALAAYTDGNTVNTRATDGYQQAVTIASLPPLADIVIRMLRHIDPDAETSNIETLKAHAQAENADRTAAANADIPLYSTIHTQTAKHAMHLFAANTNLTDVSKLTCLAMQVGVCPGRERMLLYTRACDSDSFNPEEDHSREVMEALRAEHNVDCSTATLSTVLFTDGEPTQLVIGVHGCTNHRKNEFYHTIDLTQTILPVAMDLLVMTPEMALVMTPAVGSQRRPVRPHPSTHPTLS